MLWFLRQKVGNLAVQFLAGKLPVSCSHHVIVLLPETLIYCQKYITPLPFLRKSVQSLALLVFSFLLWLQEHIADNLFLSTNTLSRTCCREWDYYATHDTCMWKLHIQLFVCLLRTGQSAKIKVQNVSSHVAFENFIEDSKCCHHCASTAKGLSASRA